MPDRAAPARPARAPAGIARPGVRAWRRTATGGATSTASTSRSPSPCTATATAIASSASSASRTRAGPQPERRRRRRGRRPRAASGRCSAGERRARRPRAGARRPTRSPSVTPSGSPNSSSSRRWGESGARASSAPSPTSPVTATAVPGPAPIRSSRRGERDQRGGDERAAAAPSSSGAPGERGEHEPRQQPVGERLGRVGQPLGDDPEAERAAERAEQRDLEQRAAADAGLERVEQEVERPPSSVRRARGAGR